MIDGNCGDGGGAHLGDESSIEDGERLAGGGAEELDDGVVGVELEGGVVGIKGDELCTDDVSVDCGHGAEPAVVWGDGQDLADRLKGMTGGEVDEGLADGGDEVWVGEDGTDLSFVEEQEVGGHGLSHYAPWEWAEYNGKDDSAECCDECRAGAD